MYILIINSEENIYFQEYYYSDVITTSEKKEAMTFDSFNTAYKFQKTMLDLGNISFKIKNKTRRKFTLNFNF